MSEKGEGEEGGEEEKDKKTEKNTREDARSCSRLRLSRKQIVLLLIGTTLLFLGFGLASRLLLCRRRRSSSSRSSISSGLCSSSSSLLLATCLVRSPQLRLLLGVLSRSLRFLGLLLRLAFLTQTRSLNFPLLLLLLLALSLSFRLKLRLVLCFLIPPTLLLGCSCMGGNLGTVTLLVGRTLCSGFFFFALSPLLFFLTCTFCFCLCRTAFFFGGCEELGRLLLPLCSLSSFGSGGGCFRLGRCLLGGGGTLGFTAAFLLFLCEPC